MPEDADDLPRTLRRERAARERANHMAQHQDWPDMPRHAVVTQLEIPFFRLMLFSLKAVLAGIPAIALLCFIVWAGMTALKSNYPELIHTRILIDFNPPAPAPAKIPAAVMQKAPAPRS